MKQLIVALDRNTEAMSWQNKFWLTPEEAAEILGIPVFRKSYSHTVKLKNLRRRGKITQFRPGKPIMYWRDEIIKLSHDIAAGKLAV